MKKTITTITAAMFAMTALASTPAAANDGLRLGIGIGALIIGEIAKGGGKGGKGGKRHKSDTLIGRVGEKPAQQRRNRNTGRKAGAAAAGAAVAAIALPEIGPAIEWRPDPASVIDPVATAAVAHEEAETPALPTLSEEANGHDVALASPPAVEIEEKEEAAQVDTRPVKMTDENRFVWGYVSPEVAEKVTQAVALGMKPSEALAALSGLKGPEKAENAPTAVSGDQKPIETETAATVEADIEPKTEKAVETAVIEPKAETPVVVANPALDVDLEQPPAVEKVEKVAEEPKKPKLDLDL